MYAAIAHIEEYDAFERKIGAPACQLVKKYLFALPASGHYKLLEDYEAVHGKSKRAYVEGAILKWKNGTSQVGGVTFQRLIDLLPQRLSDDGKYKILKLVVEHHNERSTLKQHTNFSFNRYEALNFGPIESLFEYHLDKNRQLAQLPEELCAIATWLQDTTMIILRKVLKDAADVGGANTVGKAWDDWQRLKKLALKTDDPITGNINLPDKVISIRFYTARGVVGGLLHYLFG